MTSSLDVVENGAVCVCVLRGEIDLGNARNVEDEILAAIEGNAHGLVLDLTDVSYLDSTGITLLVEVKQHLHARRQAMNVIVPKSSPLRRLFEIASLDEIIPVADSVEDAKLRLTPT